MAEIAKGNGTETKKIVKKFGCYNNFVYFCTRLITNNNSLKLYLLPIDTNLLHKKE